MEFYNLDFQLYKKKIQKRFWKSAFENAGLDNNNLLAYIFI